MQSSGYFWGTGRRKCALARVRIRPGDGAFKVNERVRIVDGPFNDFRGTVAEIDQERNKVRVMVNLFGRETTVELDFLQVEKA